MSFDSHELPPGDHAEQPSSGSDNHEQREENPEIVAAVIASDPADGPGENVILAEPVEELSRLHPSSLVFDLIAHGRTYLVPAAFGLWGAAKGDLTLLIISALIFIPAFLTSIFRYFTFRYSIQGDKLIVTSGLIFRNVRTVPVERIQNIDFVQNPLHRMMQVAEVKVETASGTKPEATLRVLAMHKMEALRKSVFERQANPATAVDLALDGVAEYNEESHDTKGLEAAHRPASSEPVLPDVKTILTIPTMWLVKAGLASNRGLIMVGVAIGAYFQFDRGAGIDVGRFRSMLPQDTSTPQIIAAAIGGLIGALILLRLLGIGWFILRFHGYKLISRNDDLRISCGLLTKVSATVPRQRIQFISIHRSLIMRLFSLASIRIETAGGAGQSDENATESVSKRWFIPVLPEAEIPRLMTELRPNFQWDESKMDFQPLAAKVGRRLTRLAIIQSVIFSLLGLIVSRYWGWSIGLVLLPIFVLWALKKSKAMRYARLENGVVYRSGVLNRKVSVTFYEKIQTLRVDQSPFDRRWKMAKLSVDTAAAGPAQHLIQIPYLDEAFAMNELQRLRSKTGQQQPVFG